MSILERWFTNSTVKQKWGILFEEDKVTITSILSSFYNAYAAWLKLVIHRSEPDVDPKIDTRTIDKELDKILKALPEVKFENEEESKEIDVDDLINNASNFNESVVDSEDSSQPSPAPAPAPTPQPVIVKRNNPNRPNLVISTGKITTSNTKLDGLYNELKKLSLKRYPNCVAASLRVFLDLAIAEYIKSENCIEAIQSRYNDRPLMKIELKQRLEFLKADKLNHNIEAQKVIKKLLQMDNEYSLDTLNNYIHGHNTHHTNKSFLNGFWDFLSPLFKAILDIKE